MKEHFPSSFAETPAAWTEERERLLRERVCDLGLKVEGSRLDGIVQRLYAELEEASISLRPAVYLSDEWGCPEGMPVIGVPFYLADERLARIQDEVMEGIEGATAEEILKYLRHETGHAFNYAYRLYETDEWRDIFGPYSRPYLEDYKPDPFSRNFVRHIAGWYAQKHPDEDFAETFAVWLTPGSDWREAYRDWGAYRKLLYVDKIVSRLGRAKPQVQAGEVHLPADELRCSVDEFAEMFRPAVVDVPPYFDADLKDIFVKRPTTKPPGDKEDDWMRASTYLVKHRRSLVNKIAYWTGLNDAIIRGLVNHFASRCKDLDLWVNPAKSMDTAIEITAYATTLCLNKLGRGDFVIK